MTNRNPIFGFSGDGRVIAALAMNACKSVFVLCNVLGPLIAGIGCSYISNFTLTSEESYLATAKHILFSSWGIVLTGIIITLTGAIGAYRDASELKQQNEMLRKDNEETVELRKRINDIEESNKGLNDEIHRLYMNLVETWLQAISKHIQLTTRERITIYYESNQEFKSLRRFSRNQILKQTHRITFPIGKGVISKAWENEIHIEDSLPQHDEHPEEYIRITSERFCYSQEEIDRLTMKSCRYLAIAIADSGTHIGVILFESLDPSAFSNNRIEGFTKYYEEHVTHLSGYIRDARNYDKLKAVNDNLPKKSAESDILEKLGT